MRNRRLKSDDVVLNNQVPQYTADPTLDDLAQRDVLNRKLLMRFNQRTIPASKHSHAPPNHIYENIWITYDIESLFVVVIIHGIKRAGTPRLRIMSNVRMESLPTQPLCQGEPVIYAGHRCSTIG